VFVIKALMFVRRTFCPRKGRFVRGGNVKLFAQSCYLEPYLLHIYYICNEVGIINRGTFLSF